MQKINWNDNDFNVFQIDGLEPRMNALIENVRPKFTQLGEVFSTYFSSHEGVEFFPHVAKHARRKVNPPNDSWVAFAPYKRGYKALPHFQIGLWGTHLFIITAIIYEAPQKVEIAERLLKNIDIFKALPEDFIISGDHMSPRAIHLKDAKDEELIALLERLRDVKKAEFLVGRHIPREEAVRLNGEQFMSLTEKTFDALLPIYDVIIGK